MIPHRGRAALSAAVLLICSAAVHAQEGEVRGNFVLPASRLEALLSAEPFSIMDWRGSRRPDDRTQRVVVMFEDSTLLTAKWASAPRDGGRFNNEPRYEAAAYEIQKLFLDEVDYVVPPTIIRAFPLDFVQAQVPDHRPTFGQAPRSVVVALQYWLFNVQPEDFWHPDRVKTDTLYARRIANFNILTYLIGHRDANSGNFLVSRDFSDPHVYAVDNGVSFGSDPSNRGELWKDIQIDRLPRSVIDRLKPLTRQDLERVLGVLVEFQIRDGELVRVEPGENLGRNRGVRVRGDRVQFGLTGREIRDVEQRLDQLVGDVNARRYILF
jgi:hypothetical protein